MYGYDDFGLYIGGAWGPSGGGRVKEVFDPATEEVLGTVPDATPEDLDRALASAERGFSVWRRVQPWERAAKLRKVADLIRERIEPYSKIMSAESGKPLAESRGEWGATADQFEWYAEETKRIYGQLIEGREPDVRLSVIYQPVGVVAALSAWNFPALLPARKVAAALGAGCSVVLKPAGETPATAMAIVQACADAGLPEGAVNLVTGNSSKISEHLIRSPIVRKVSLTGSVPVGKQILKLAAEGVKKVSMELGGHAPVLVFDDADVRQAAETSAATKFRNCGQVCISPSRFFVHERVYDEFADSFVAAVKKLKLGRFDQDGVNLGPLANQRGLDNAKALVEDAVDKGAELLAGGQQPAGFNRGYFFEPTVLGRTPDEARVMIDEPFGPVAPLTTFSDFDEVISRANGVPFGLAGYVFTKSLRMAAQASEALEVGMVGVNDMMLAAAEIPFGGVKESGMGREGGSLGIKDYLEPKYVKTRL
ncbi:NAD-dependent succinate-semialdehyde dehydrogenase [Hansschlegelia zhihuaiae]|uniref:NAD-dependent succinate-semialdehyde dehydrogenase n=1 Tax=Hansschlegelia zhihuaiae TaxID=405005 RepID=A0A4Q0MGX5_9HYPH|nr:NAD-dependent succinate-semialdehyde dehydrogenase [Hansschlegelia zhihuaiae]RXF72664.1 NAD-dependent succinate-semialdehyde dehydrogenase [Hansschlegelia zhihuaiae]